MTEYKIVASDLDGTFLDSKGKISRENYDAITEFAEKGVFFVPASGRSYVEMPEELKNHPDIRYYIHSSGAVVYDKMTNERISFCFPKQLSSKLFGFLFGVDCHLTVRRMGKMYTAAEFMSKEHFLRYGVWQPHIDLLEGVGEAIDSFNDVFISADEVEMISVFMKEGERFFDLKARLSEFPEVNVASACENNIELTYAKAGKGNALRALAERIGCGIDQTIAVGDSENDIPMVSAAGLGLAVSNATEKLKSNADVLICSNDENTARYVLKKYFS